jgi:multiple sugar transport system permease protein
LIGRGSARSRWRKSWRRNLEGYLFVSPAILGLLLWSLGPTVSAFYLSLTRYDLFSAPAWSGLDNYLRLSQDPQFWQAMRVTFTYTLLAVPLEMAGGLALALLLNGGIRGVALFRTAFYLPSVVPLVVTTTLWVWLLDPQFGLVNAALAALHLPQGLWFSDPSTALPSLVLVGLWQVGGPMLIYLAGLQSIPEQYHEAAQLDGAGTLALWWHVTLPLLTPTLFYTLILGLINSLQHFTGAYIASGGLPGAPLNSLLFLAVYIYQAAFDWMQMGYASAMAWVLFVILLALTLMVFRTARLWVFYEGGPS